MSSSFWLKPGAKLPSKNALASHFGVSGPVAREAIALPEQRRLRRLRGQEARTPERRGVLTSASVNSLLDVSADEKLRAARGARAPFGRVSYDGGGHT